MKPSIGRIVHYVAYGTPKGEYPEGVCCAAIVTGVFPNDVVECCILNPTGIFFNTGCAHDESHTPGTWHWPEQVT